MENRDSQFAIKWLPSLADLAFLAPIWFLFGRMQGVKTLLGDGDTGWHIRTGEWIVANHLVPTHDVFSFSKPGGVWFAWEWLSDVIFAGLNGMWGLGGVVLLSVLLLSATFTVLFLVARRKANAVTAIAVTIVAAAASSVHWLARPHLFTLLFVILFYAALERMREGQTRWGRWPYLALLPGATIVWTNLHGGFFVGIALAGVYGAGELAQMALTADREARGPAWQRAKRYFACAGGCLAASLINPYTYHLHAHLLEYLRDPYASQHIIEFFSLSFHHPAAIFFESMLLLAAVSVFWYARQGRYTESLLLLVFGHLGLMAARNIPIFVLVAAPPVAGLVQAWLNGLPELELAQWVRRAAAKYNQMAARTAETDQIARWHVVSVLGMAMVAALLFAPAPPKRFHAEFDPQNYPAKAIAALKRMPEPRIFTNDVWGGYLIWRLYPADKVFVDGRSDFYGSAFEEKFIDVLNVKYDWERILGGFDVDTILLPTDAPLAGALKESSRWRVVYDDGVALIFRPIEKTGGKTTSAAYQDSGAGRDREVTKTQARDQAITEKRTKT
ncbi:MAG: hypothetical protein ABSB88_03660 [Bryobacteraceae bacterium]|jgi:hypothetical protein